MERAEASRASAVAASDELIMRIVVEKEKAAAEMNSMNALLEAAQMQVAALSKVCTVKNLRAPPPPPPPPPRGFWLWFCF